MPATRFNRWSKPEALFFAVVFLSAAAVSLPPLWRLTRFAAELAPLRYSDRRDRVLDIYPAVRDIRRRVPESEPLAIVVMRPEEYDVAIFASHYLYPRTTRLYHRLEDYRRSLDPPPPKTILRVDGRRSQKLWLMTYEEIRREAMDGRGIVPDPRPTSERWRELIVPLVASIDGAPPDSYTTEAVLVADAPGEVTFTLWPSGRTRMFEVDANQPLRLVDVVDQSFATMTQGWLQISSNVPVRSAFWFVNRGTNKTSAVAQIDALPKLPLRVVGGERLWVLNAGDREAVVNINGTKETIEPHGWRATQASKENVIGGEGSVFAFASTKLPDGNTAFFWPERAP